MNHIDFAMGVYYPDGGIYTIIQSLERIGKKHGVTLRTNAPVVKILTKAGSAVGVELKDGTVIDADIVVSNADRAFTELELLDSEHRQFDREYWQKCTQAPSAFIIYLALDGKIPSLVHHNLLFCRDWEKNFAEVFDEKILPSDPSYYVCCPTKTDGTIAPENQEQLFVLVPIPAGITISKEQERVYRDKIIHSLAKDMNIENLEQRILHERIYHNDDFTRDYNAFGGTALGLAHTLRQTAIWRPNNYTPKCKNLYFVGADTNPGIGMPICLISAEMVYKRIEGINIDAPLEKL
jgi:phytoene desaturase